MNFRDTTEYRRNETSREPRTWTAGDDRLQVIVHRHIDYPKDVWLVSWRPSIWPMTELRHKAVALAFREAAHITRERLRAMLAAVEAPSATDAAATGGDV